MEQHLGSPQVLVAFVGFRGPRCPLPSQSAGACPVAGLKPPRAFHGLTPLLRVLAGARRGRGARGPTEPHSLGRAWEALACRGGLPSAWRLLRRCRSAAPRCSTWRTEGGARSPRGGRGARTAVECEPGSSGSARRRSSAVRCPSPAARRSTNLPLGCVWSPRLSTRRGGGGRGERGVRGFAVAEGRILSGGACRVPLVFPSLRSPPPTPRLPLSLPPIRRAAGACDMRLLPRDGPRV